MPAAALSQLCVLPQSADILYQMAVALHANPITDSVAWLKRNRDATEVRSNKGKISKR